MKKDDVKKIWSEQDDILLLCLQKKYGCDWAKISMEIPNTNRVRIRQRYLYLMRIKTRDKTHNHIISEIDKASYLDTTYMSSEPWVRENKEIFVKHLNVDEQLIQFFKKESIRKNKEIKKDSDPAILTEKTKKLFDVFSKLFVKINVPECIDDTPMDENDFDSLVSLKNFIEQRTTRTPEKIEQVRFQMFGPQKVLPESTRFVPPLPFNFRVPKSKQKNSTIIEYIPRTNDTHQLELNMHFEHNIYVACYLTEDEEYQFEKFNNFLSEAKDNRFSSFRKIQCKSFAKYSAFLHYNKVYLFLTLSFKLRYN